MLRVTSILAVSRNSHADVSLMIAACSSRWCETSRWCWLWRRNSRLWRLQRLQTRPRGWYPLEGSPGSPWAVCNIWASYTNLYYIVSYIYIHYTYYIDNSTYIYIHYIYYYIWYKYIYISWYIYIWCIYIFNFILNIDTILILYTLYYIYIIWYLYI